MASRTTARRRRSPGEAAPVERHVGRPSKLTPVVSETLLALLRIGQFREVACRYAGIDPSTFYRWVTDPRPRYVAFREAVEHAEAIAAVQIVANVVKLSRTNARAGIWWLERRYPAEWGPHARREGVEETQPQAGLADGSKWTAVPMPPGFAEKCGILEGPIPSADT